MAKTKEKQKTGKSPARSKPGGSATDFDPRVLIFACNWCSYAGADTAGISRLAQTPHFRLLRVMCSGRVHPSFVLRAFARGADGVMVSGCHFGDCHYRFGNYRAVEQYDIVTKLMTMLGIDSARSRLEWISAAEGIRFAQVMNEFIEEVRSAGPSPITPETVESGPAAVAEACDCDDISLTPNLYSCLECGRCTAVCPVVRHQKFSPRRLISHAFTGGFAAISNEPTLWTCLTCGRCSAVCPVEVDYSDFILKARAAAVGCGKKAEDTGVVPCSHGGVFEQISILHTRSALRQQRLDWVTEDLKVKILNEGETKQDCDLLFTGCSPYFAAYFPGKTGNGLNHSQQSVVKLLNRVGITPTLLANERCCGYHMRLTGKTDIADKLASMVIDQIKTSGARRVIVSCPECVKALQAAVSSYGGQFEIIHLSELLCSDSSPLLPENNKSKKNQANETVTFQDPCRLGRGSGFYDFPRDLLRQVAGVDVVDMPRSREQAVCCGNTAWLNCNAGTKTFQTDRLEEASATGGKRLITACPGCYIHLHCAQGGAEEQTSDSIEITDIWSLLAGNPPDNGNSKDD